MSVINFTVHKNTRDKRERRRVHQNLTDRINSSGKEWDGYGLVLYRRERDGTISTLTDYSVRDAYDLMGLPSLVEMKLRQGIYRSTHSDD